MYDPYSSLFLIFNNNLFLLKSDNNKFLSLINPFVVVAVVVVAVFVVVVTPEFE